MVKRANQCSLNMKLALIESILNFENRAPHIKFFDNIVKQSTNSHDQVFKAKLETKEYLLHNFFQEQT